MLWYEPLHGVIKIVTITRGCCIFESNSSQGALLCSQGLGRRGREYEQDVSDSTEFARTSGALEHLSLCLSIDVAIHEDELY